MKKILFTFSIIIFLASAIFPQQVKNDKAKRIVFVDDFAFANDKTGIIKLVRAFNQMGMLDCFPSPCSQEQYEKREKIFVEPVLGEISDLLKQIENQNNVVILRLAELYSTGQPLVVNKEFEITEQFINFFNNKSNPSTKTLEINIAESRIALINTDTFYNRAIGINQIIKIGSEKVIDLGTFCEKTTICQGIGKSIQSYATNKGYSVIFDSSKNLPKEIENFKIDDLTQDFISEYNKNNP